MINKKKDKKNNYNKNIIESNIDIENLLGRKTERRSKIEANKNLNLINLTNKSKGIIIRDPNSCYICNSRNCELECNNCDNKAHKFCACIDKKNKLKSWLCTNCIKD